MNSIGQKFLGGTIWMSAFQILTYIFSFVANIVLARLLTPNDFGVFALGLSILAVFYILSSWSFSIAIVQAVEIDQMFFDTAYGLSLVLGCGIFVLVVMGSLILRDIYSVQVLQILVILSIFRIPGLLSSCYSATSQRELNFKLISVILMIVRVVSIVVTVMMAWLGFGVWSLVVKVAIVGIGDYCGMRLISSWRFRWQLDIVSAKRLFSFGSKMMIARGLESFIADFRGFIIGTFLGTTALGYFDRGIKLAELGHTAAGPAVGQVSLAAYSRLQNSPNKLTQAFEATNYLLIRLFTLVAIIFLLFGEDITVWLYGEKWRAAGEIVSLLSVYAALLTVFENVKSLLYSQAKIRAVIKVRAIQGGLLIVGMVLALPTYGLLGAALVIDLLHLIGTILMFVFVKERVTNVNKIWLPPVIAGFVTLLFYLYYQSSELVVNNSIQSLFVILLVILIYFMVLLLLEWKRWQRDIGYLLELIRGEVTE